MIHILTEDSKDGFKLCDIIKQLYFDNNFNDIDLDTLKGIWNVKTKIETKINQIPANDIIIIVYDDIRENPLIDMYISEALDYIDNQNLYDRIFWLPTKSFEIEVLLIDGIEFFADKEAYSLYFSNLRQLYSMNNEIENLTSVTKTNNLYNNMYNKAKKEKIKSRNYSALSSEDFERAITIETISKYIMTEVFKNVTMDKPMGGCWIQECSYNHNKCVHEYIDLKKIIRKQSKNKYFKANIIISNTSYKRLVETIYEMKNKTINIKPINIYNLLNSSIIHANYINTKI